MIDSSRVRTGRDVRTRRLGLRGPDARHGLPRIMIHKNNDNNNSNNKNNDNNNNNDNDTNNDNDNNNADNNNNEHDNKYDNNT